MVFSNYNRFLIGLLLVITVLISYFLNLDHLLLIIIIFLVTYDLNNLKITNSIYLITLLIITIFLIFFSTYQLFTSLYILETFLIILFFLNMKLKKEIFLFSIYIFCLILFYIINVNRDIFYLIILISFFNDTIAYISGKKLGGPLITPIISPNKTWSGTTISFVFTTTALFLLNFNIFLSATISIFLFLGDIFFSYIKRLLDIKDFSLLLGGHGGILDRLDSMFFVAIIFQFYLVIFL